LRDFEDKLYLLSFALITLLVLLSLFMVGLGVLQVFGIVPNDFVWNIMTYSVFTPFYFFLVFIISFLGIVEASL